MIVFTKRSFPYNPTFFTIFVGSAWPKALPASVDAATSHLRAHIRFPEGISHRQFPPEWTMQCCVMSSTDISYVTTTEEELHDIALEHPYALGNFPPSLFFALRIGHAMSGADIPPISRYAVNMRFPVLTWFALPCLTVMVQCPSIRCGVF
eukprot:1887965-Rhodomonas_salina.2